MTASAAEGPVRVQVVAGSPTHGEIAAIAAVLLARSAEQRPESEGRTPRWGRAARFEAIGQAPFVSAIDARLQHRGSGGLTPGAS